MRWDITINTYLAVWRPILSQGGHLQKPKMFVGAAGGKGEGTGAAVSSAGYAHG